MIWCVSSKRQGYHSMDPLPLYNRRIRRTYLEMVEETRWHAMVMMLPLLLMVVVGIPTYPFWWMGYSSDTERLQYRIPGHWASLIQTRSMIHSHQKRRWPAWTKITYLNIIAILYIIRNAIHPVAYFKIGL